MAGIYFITMKSDQKAYGNSGLVTYKKQAASKDLTQSLLSLANYNVI
jgi:hypothetical protein